MKRFFSGHLTNSGWNGYSCVVLSSNAEIRQLADVARQLNQQDDPMLDPEFFLASVCKGWRPKVVAISYGREVVGMVYTKERVIHGIPTGVVSCDGSLGSIQLGNPPASTEFIPSCDGDVASISQDTGCAAQTPAMQRRT